jgi:Ca-activated chloride channel homolog
MRRIAVVALAVASHGIGCARPPAPSAQGTSASASAPVPLLAPASGAPARAALQPGIDLEGTPPQPVRAPRRRGAGAGKSTTPLDLGADRATVALALPAPPHGAAAPFTFGDGREGWVARVPDTYQLPQVAYGEGRIFVSGGFESTSFYALDARDGHMLWGSQQLEDNGPTAPTYLDHRVIFNTESCTLFVVDAQTGRKLWLKNLGDPTPTQPAVADGLVFASHPGGESTGQALSAYRLATGDEVWSRDIDHELLASPVVHGDSVYVSTLGGRSYRFLHKTGKRVWARSLGATSAPWVEGDELYFSRRLKGGKEVQAVASATTGEILREHGAVAARWLADVPADMENWPQVWAFEGSRPAVIDGVRYVAMGGTIQASDPRSGEPFWTRRYAPAADKRSLGAVAVAGSEVVIATRGGDLYGLDVDTGYTLWAYATGKRIVAQPVVARGWVYAATADGQVIALNVGDTSLDGWHMWGGNSRHDGLVPTSPPATTQQAIR